MRYFSLLLACAALMAGSLTAQAQNLTYTLTGVGDGTLTPTGGGVSVVFLNTPFTFTYTADPAGVFDRANYLLTPVGNIDFTLGSNVGQLQNAVFYEQSLRNGASVAGVGVLNVSTTLQGVTLTSVSITLTAPQSPVSLAYDGSGSSPATFGTVLFTNTTRLTFSSTAVPEPGCLALLAGMGTVGAAFLRRRVKVRNTA